MHPPDAIMVFAAGRGTRMGALTAGQPKAMIEVAGHRLIDHALELAMAADPARVVVNTHHHAAVLQAHLATHWRDVAISHEVELLETGGGLRAALPLMGAGPVHTLNSDAVWRGPNPLKVLRAAWDPARMDALLMVVPRARAQGHRSPGDFFMKAGQLTRRGTAETAPFVYTGTQIVRTDGLDGFAEKAFSFNLLWDKMVAKGRLFGLAYEGEWVDVGQPDSIPLATALLRP